MSIQGATQMRGYSQKRTHPTRLFNLPGQQPASPTPSNPPWIICNR